MKKVPVVAIIVLSTAYLSFALFMQKDSAELAPSPPASSSSSSSADDQDDSAKAKAIENRNKSADTNPYLKEMGESFAAAPYVTIDASLATLIREKITEGHADKSGKEMLANFRKNLKPESGLSKFLPAIFDAADKKDAKAGLAACLSAIDYLDQHPDTDKEQPITLYIPFAYGARFAYQSGDTRQAAALAQEALLAARKCNDLGLADLESLYYSFSDTDADFARYSKAAAELKERLAANRFDDLKGPVSEMLIASEGLPKYTSFYLFAKMANGILLEKTLHDRMKAIEIFKTVRDKSTECGDKALLEEVNAIIDSLENPH